MTEANSKHDKKPATAFTGYQLFVIALLAIMQFSVVLGFSIMSPLGDMMIKQLQIDTTQFGALISCYAFGAGVSGIMAATIADRFDRKKFLLFFYAGYLIGMFLCSISHSYAFLMAARCVTGIFGGVIASISLSIVSDLFSLNQRGRVMGFIQMAFAVSQVVGIPCGLLLANHWGWNSTFLAIALLSVIIGMAIAFKMKPITEHTLLQDKQNTLIRLWRMISTRQYMKGYALTGLSSIGGAMLAPFSAVFIINNVGVTQEQLPLIFVCTGLASACVMPLVGKWSDKMPKQHVFLIGSILAMIMIVAFTHLTPVPLWMVIILNIFMFAGISSRMVPAMALNTAIPDQKDRGAYMSLCSSLQQLSNGVGALIAGLIVFQATKTSPLQYFDRVGYAVVIMSAVCIVLVYRIAAAINKKEPEKNA